MKIKLCRLRQVGATIVEAVMAVATLGTIASGLMGSFTYGFYMMRLVRENQRATQIILEKVETVRLYRWDQINSPGFVPATFTDRFDPQGGTGCVGVTYSGTLTITNAPFNTSYSDDLRELIITVSWPSGSKNRVRTLSTLVAKDGLQNYVY